MTVTTYALLTNILMSSTMAFASTSTPSSTTELQADKDSLKIQADKGDEKAQYDWAVKLQNEIKDLKESEIYLKKSADAGYGPAQAHYAAILEEKDMLLHRKPQSMTEPYIKYYLMATENLAKDAESVEAKKQAEIQLSGIYYSLGEKKKIKGYEDAGKRAGFYKEALEMYQKAKQLIKDKNNQNKQIQKVDQALEDIRLKISKIK